MPLMKSKQVDKIISAPVKITGLAVSSASTEVIITTVLSSALQQAGNGGTSVPFQVSNHVLEQGVVVVPPVNRTDIFNNITKEKLAPESKLRASIKANKPEPVAA